MKSTSRCDELFLRVNSRLCAHLGLSVLLLLGLGYGVARGQEAQQEPLSQHPQMAQPQSSEPKIAVEVKSVSVPVTVRDKHGKIISNLTKDDFVVEEDGRPQTINYFAREKDLPLRLGLLVDTSLSQRKVLEEERSASYSFLDQMLHSKDLAFVIHFDREVELLQDFTAERPKLQEALQSLQTPQFNASSGGQSGGGGQGGSTGGPGMGGGRRGGGGSRGGGSGRGGGTLLYDAVYLAGDELMGKQQGRKALIILSDGVDHGSREGLATAIETAQRADTVVYSILFKDDEEYGGGRGGSVSMGPIGMGRRGGGRGPREERPDGKKILQQISKETGGRMFEVSKKETVEKIYAQIQEELRNQYSLGYTPDKSAGPGYHKIHVTVKQKDLEAQARDGYYSGQ
jgi:VWFA-related protein